MFSKATNKPKRGAKRGWTDGRTNIYGNEWEKIKEMVIPLWKTIMSVETNETMVSIFAAENNPSPSPFNTEKKHQKELESQEGEKTKTHYKHSGYIGLLFTLNGEAKSQTIRPRWYIRVFHVEL